MTQPEPPRPPVPAARRRALRPTPLALGAGGAVLVLLIGLYAGRNLIAREALIGWLRERGAPAEVEIGSLGPSGLKARVVLGPRDRPDLSVEDSEIGYALTGPWAGQPFGVQVRSLRLVRPVLRARLRGGELSFGALDPVIADLRARPPRPGVPQPTIRVEGGRVILDSDHGRADLRADALVDKGRLARLNGRLAATALRSGDLTLKVRAGALTLRTEGDRIGVDLSMQLDGFEGPKTEIERVRARITGEIPYPDLQARSWNGTVALRLAASAGRAAAGAAHVEAPRLTGAFAGRATGWIETLSLAGSGTADVTATGLDAESLETRDLALNLAGSSLRWTRAGADRVTGDLKVDATVARYAQANLRLRVIRASLAGPLQVGPSGSALALQGAIEGKGAIADLPPPSRLDVAEVAAVKRLLSSFTLNAPHVSARIDARGLTLELAEPLRLADSAGGTVTVSAARGRPAYREGQGSLDIDVAGGGLPKARAAVDDYRVTASGLVAPMRLTAASDFEPARDATLNVSGELRVAGGATRFVSRGCAAVAAQRLEFGDNDVEGPAGELCPGAGPLFEYRDGSWRVRGRAKGAGGRLTLLQARVSDAAGPAEFGMTNGALFADVNVETARITDLAESPRFNPLRASGPAILRDGVWQTAVVVADPQGRRLAEAQLSHDVRFGTGELNIDTGVLTFAQGGLQPAALSPLAAALGAPVSGSAGFSGEIGWSADGLTSHGALSIPRLDFTSPAGAVHGLSGEIVFTSLTPPAAPVEQRLRIAEVAAFAPLSNVAATLGIEDGAVQIRDVEAETGGGQLRVAAIDFPLMPKEPWGGVLEVEGVQVKDMVEHSPFADRMDLTAKVSGSVPFQMVPQGLRIANGELHAIEDGRLSIRREALAGTTATQPTADAPQAPPNAFSDFAYQAMENLAFSTLSAEINSLPEGRLGVLFHIKGENQPPERQVLEVGVGDLLSRKFLEKSQPLPSGTKVDLTLDTSLNLDQLLDDVAGYRNARNSAGVQGAGSIPPQGPLENAK